MGVIGSNPAYGAFGFLARNEGRVYEEIDVVLFFGRKCGRGIFTTAG
jgi:hypothetical protein